MNSLENNMKTNILALVTKTYDRLIEPIENVQKTVLKI